MRCSSCHGLRMIGDQPCPECLGGQVSCCDGAVSLDPIDRAVQSYVDPSFPERQCDYCGKPYRGPAVYCSLICAVDDI